MAHAPQRAASQDFDTRDKKPLHERKSDEQAGSTVNRGDANAIGSPDVFLADRHRELPAGNGTRIVQVKAEGADRAYVITQGSKVGYFELAEGMPRAEAEAALAGAFDGTAVVL